MTVNFFCQTFHFFLQYALLARYSNSKKKNLRFCFFQFLIIPIVILFIAAYFFFFNWLYVTNSWISLKLLIWVTLAFSSHSKCKFLFALCMVASGDWGEGMREAGELIHLGLGLGDWPGAVLASLAQPPPGDNLCQDSTFRAFTWGRNAGDSQFLFSFSAFCFTFGILGFTWCSSLLFSAIFNH